MRGLRTSVASVAVAVALGGCGAAASPGGGPVEAPPTTTQEEVMPDFAGGMPPVTVTGVEGAVDLRPWTYCWTTGCADGSPPEVVEHVGASRDLRFTFPVPGWSFEAIFRPADQPCGRRQSVPVERGLAQEHVVGPAGPAGTYDVDLFGRGPEGDVVVTVRWTTTEDGPFPIPTASLAVLAENDGIVDSYGVELLVDDLVSTPAQVSATIIVTSSEGAAVTLEPTRRAGECQEEGWILLDAPVEQGQEAAAQGSAPFTYDVALTLDGRRHAATATWPDDVLPDYAPSVRLDFDPPLPALTP